MRGVFLFIAGFFLLGREPQGAGLFLLLAALFGSDS